MAQARSLNVLAYINRTQVAHQVAMAHLVTLASWSQFEQTQSQQRMARNPPASLIKRIFGTAVGKAYAQARVSDDVLPELEQAFQAHDEIVHQVLEGASASVVDDMADLRQQMMWRVLYANYPQYVPVDAGLSKDGPLRLVLLSDGLSGYVQRHVGDGDGHQRDMIAQAVGRYEFLQQRTMTRRNSRVVNDICPTKRHELRRHGRTWLDESGQWSAQDTLSFHALRSNRWIGCYFREYPMGWGGVRSQSGAETPVFENPPHTFSQQDFWRWVHEHTSWDLFEGQSNSMADEHALFGALKWASRGLPTYHDLNGESVHRALRFAIQVQQVAAPLPKAEGADPMRSPVGRFASHELKSDDFVTVKSAAETYFVDSALPADQGSELASLFRPYWQARLSPVSDIDLPKDRS